MIVLDRRALIGTHKSAGAKNIMTVSHAQEFPCPPSSPELLRIPMYLLTSALPHDSLLCLFISSVRYSLVRVVPLSTL